MKSGKLEIVQNQFALTITPESSRSWQCLLFAEKSIPPWIRIVDDRHERPTASMMATDQMQHEVTIMGGFERSGGRVYQRDGLRFRASAIRIA